MKKKLVIRKKFVLFIILYFAIVTFYFSLTTLSKYVGVISGNGNAVIAKWEVSLDTSDNENSTLDMIIGNTTQNYILKITSTSEVIAKYSIVLSNLPDGVQVKLDDGTFQIQEDNTITFEDVGHINANAENRTITHILCFMVPIGANTITESEINVDVIFVQADPVTRYTVTFNTDGGSLVPSQRIIADSTAIMPETPEKLGYTFVEWVDSSNNAYDFDTPVTSDITLTAVWEEKTNAISLEAGYGISEIALGNNAGRIIAMRMHYGDTLDLSTISKTYLTDFSGAKYYIKNGNNYTEINGSTYTVGDSDVTIVVDPAYPNKCYCNVSTLTAGTTCDIGSFTYKYKYKASATSWTSITDNGWGVKLTNKTSTAPVTDTMCAYINDKPLVNTMHAFTSSKATSIDVSNYYMKNVNQMTYMFYKAEASEIIGISNFGQINAANIGGMFSEMPNIRVLDLTGWDTSNVTNFNALFRKSSSLETIYASTSFVTNLSSQTGTNVFSNCSSLVGGAGTIYDDSNVNKTYARIDGLDGLPGYFTQGPPPATP